MGSSSGAPGSTVADRAGAIDISFNAVSPDHLHGTPLTEMRFEDFAQPISVAMKTQFLTAKAGARHMAKRGSGVILAPTGSGRNAAPTMGGTVVSWAAVQALCRQLACELGPQGIRVVWLQTPGSPESIPDTVDFGGGMTRDDVIKWIESGTMLKRLPALAEVGNVAAFLASDQASTMTATSANITGGATVE